jgi:hypothetical protein
MIYAIGTNWDYLVAKRIYDLYNSDVSGLMIYDANKPRPCYFVLWIEWVYGVAYRRACGAVAAELWEQETEEELVVLMFGLLSHGHKSSATSLAGSKFNPKR